MPEKRKNSASPQVESRSGLEISPKAARSGLPEADPIDHPCRCGRRRTKRCRVRPPHATGKPGKNLAIWEPRLHPRHFLAISARLRRRGRDEPGLRHDTRRSAALSAHGYHGCGRDTQAPVVCDDRETRSLTQVQMIGRGAPHLRPRQPITGYEAIADTRA